MNTHARLLLAAALSLCGFGAQAQSAPAADAASQETPAPTVRSVDDRRCLRYTGSLVVAAENAREDRKAKAARSGSDANASRGNCVSANGRAYSQDDLRGTGQTDVGHALQMLDPSVRIGR